MGRIRKAARFTFSVGGYDGISPIRKESSAESIGRETNRLLAGYPVPAPGTVWPAGRSAGDQPAAHMRGMQVSGNAQQQVLSRAGVNLITCPPSCRREASHLLPGKQPAHTPATVQQLM